MNSSQEKPDPRVGYIAGLRALANLLDANPEIPLPYTGAGTELQWIVVNHDNQRETLAALARVMPGTVRKDVRDGYFDLYGTIHGLRLRVIADREKVCERIVTGTREVTKEIPDPEALAAVPTVTVTETVEDVEWVCTPLLADTAAVTA